MLYLGLPAPFVVLEVWLILCAFSVPSLFALLWIEGGFDG